MGRNKKNSDPTFEEIRDIHNLEFREGDHSSSGGSNEYANDDGALFLNGDYLGHVKDYERQQKDGEDTDDFSSMYQKSNLKKAADVSSFNTIYDVGVGINKRFSGSKADGGEGDEGPVEPRQKSEEHIALEGEYGEGAFPELTSATDSYNSAFKNATDAGREMTSGDYIRQRADDKRGWVTNRFMPHLSTKNELARHEQHHAASNAIDRIFAAGVEPPSLSDPMDIYDRMRDDIEDIG